MRFRRVWAAPSCWSGHALLRLRRSRAALRLGPSGVDRCRGARCTQERPERAVELAARALDTTTRHQRTVARPTRTTPGAITRQSWWSRRVSTHSGYGRSAAVNDPQSSQSKSTAPGITGPGRKAVPLYSSSSSVWSEPPFLRPGLRDAHLTPLCSRRRLKRTLQCRKHDLRVRREFGNERGKRRKHKGNFGSVWDSQNY